MMPGVGAGTGVGTGTGEQRPAEQSSLRPQLLPAALCAATVALASHDSARPWLGLLLGLIAAGFVFVVHAPVWTLAPILLVEMSLSNYIFAEIGVSLRLAVTLFAALLALPAVLRFLPQAEAHGRRVMLPALAFVVLVTIGNTLHSGDDYTFKYLRYQATQVLALILVAALVRTPRDLRRVAVVALAIGTVSAVAALWQHFAAASAPYGIQNAATISLWKGRAVGLADNPVLLANHMVSVLVPALGVAATGGVRGRRSWVVLGLAIAALAGGVYMTYTRSALFAVAPGLAAIGLCLRGQRRSLVLGAVVGAALLFQLLQGTGLIGARYYKDASNDRSAASHEGLWEVAFAIALDHPITGVGHQEFENLSVEYENKVNVSLELDLPESASVVAGQDPHNDFLNVWLSWGILSLVAYVALFAGTLANLLASLRQRDPLLRGVAVGCVGGLVTYAVNSAYHNYLDSSVVLWVYAGLSAALAGLATPGSFLAHWGRGRARRGRHMALSVHSVAPPRRSGSAQPRAADNGARRYA